MSMHANLNINDQIHPSLNAGIAVELVPIEQNMMDSGSWYWKYKIKGLHIELELVEF